ncbi:MAG: hypothetical protein AAF566_13235 [Pseudomonadota bacterium]
MQLVATAAAKIISAAGSGATVAKALSIAGTAASVSGAISAGNAAKAESEFQAKQLEQKGKAELASASYGIAEQRRQTDLIQSSAQAAGAASGGGLDFEISSAIEDEGTYREMLGLAEGQDAVLAYTNAAAAARTSGRSANQASGLKALGQGIRGYSAYVDDFGAPLKSLRDKYG